MRSCLYDIINKSVFNESVSNEYLTAAAAFNPSPFCTNGCFAIFPFLHIVSTKGKQTNLQNAKFDDWFQFLLTRLLQKIIKTIKWSWI